MWTLADGTALFDLSQLLAYRRGEHDPSAQLAAVDDAAARDLILHMTARDPAGGGHSEQPLHGPTTSTIRN
jgi:hypothetical protein